MMKKHRNFLLSVFVLLLISGGGAYIFWLNKPRPENVVKKRPQKRKDVYKLRDYKLRVKQDSDITDDIQLKVINLRNHIVDTLIFSKYSYKEINIGLADNTKYLIVCSLTNQEFTIDTRELNDTVEINILTKSLCVPTEFCFYNSSNRDWESDTITVINLEDRDKKIFVDPKKNKFSASLLPGNYAIFIDEGNIGYAKYKFSVYESEIGKKTTIMVPYKGAREVNVRSKIGDGFDSVEVTLLKFVDINSRLKLIYHSFHYNNLNAKIFVHEKGIYKIYPYKDGVISRDTVTIYPDYSEYRTQSPSNNHKVKQKKQEDNRKKYNLKGTLELNNYPDLIETLLYILKIPEKEGEPYEIYHTIVEDDIFNFNNLPAGEYVLGNLIIQGIPFILTYDNIILLEDNLDVNTIHYIKSESEYKCSVTVFTKPKVVSDLRDLTRAAEANALVFCVSETGPRLYVAYDRSASNVYDLVGLKEGQYKIYVQLNDNIPVFAEEVIFNKEKVFQQVIYNSNK